MASDEALARLIRHDIRSPLAVVLGQCELLQLEAHGPITQRQRDALDTIRKHAERALMMLDEAGSQLGSNEAP